MINFRFHLISLVAVFLALGIGVAAGASFVDRATVESLQGRVEDLDTAYRERGVELDLTREALGTTDRQLGALAGEGSLALEDGVDGQTVVLLVSDGVPAELLSDLRVSFAAAGAPDLTVLRLLAAFEFDDPTTTERVATALGLAPDRRTPERVREAAVATLAASLAELSGPAPGLAQPDSPVPVPVAGLPGPVPTDDAAAIAAIDELDQLGLLSVESPVGPVAVALGGAPGVRYLEVLTPSDDLAATTVMVPLAESLASAAPATLTVGLAAPARPEGGIVTTTTAPGEVVEDPLAGLRARPSATRLSTVDDLEEPAGRIAAVYAVGQQRRTGAVGAYGTGPGVVGPFPTTPPG